MKKPKHIKIKVKPIITFEKFLKLINDYAEEKYAAKVYPIKEYVYVHDVLGISAYKDLLFKEWFKLYKKGYKNEYKEAFDVLLYLQNLQLFVNMFQQQKEEYSQQQEDDE